MTGSDAAQAAANLLAQARDAKDSDQPFMAAGLVAEAQAWATLALAIESGAAEPHYPDPAAPVNPAGG